MPPRTTPRRAFQDEGTRIFQAQRAAAQYRERAEAERRAVISLSRDELKALAQQMADVSEIAARHHIELAAAGSLPPDVFPGPTDA